MMRTFCRGLLIAGLIICASICLSAAEYRLSNGDVYKGEAVGFDDEGFVVRLDIGGFSTRLSWSRLTQETLKDLMKNPQAAPFAEPFIELTAEEQEKKREKKPIIIKPVPRMELPVRTSFFAAFGSPVGLFIFGMLYLANLLAGFEVAIFRQRPIALVVGLSAVLPVVGPLLFLSLPPGAEPEAYEGASAMDGSGEAAGLGAPGGRQTNRVAGATPPGQPGGGGLSVAAVDKTGSSTPVAEQGVYRRGEFTFNRRFFETKFPGFFRVVPSEAEKDLVFVVRAAKNEYVAKRISRISSNEMHLQLLRGGTEAMVTFADIIEVQVRHKDAKA